jgi:hypothetical protein
MVHIKTIFVLCVETIIAIEERAIIIVPESNPHMYCNAPPLD